MKTTTINNEATVRNEATVSVNEVINKLASSLGMDANSIRNMTLIDIIIDQLSKEYGIDVRNYLNCNIVEIINAMINDYNTCNSILPTYDELYDALNYGAASFCFSKHEILIDIEMIGAFTGMLRIHFGNDGVIDDVALIRGSVQRYAMIGPWTIRYGIRINRNNFDNWSMIQKIIDDPRFN